MTEVCKWRTYEDEGKRWKSSRRGYKRTALQVLSDKLACLDYDLSICVCDEICDELSTQSTYTQMSL